MKRTFLGFCAALCLFTQPATAQTVDDVLDVTVLTGWRNADGTHTAGLQIKLAPGWTTYWRQPGDVGIPPQFEWAASTNVVSVDVKWPTPKVSWYYGARSIGYETKVILPLIVTPQTNGQIQLAANVLIGVCEEICIPVDLKISVMLPTKGRSDASIHKALAAQPKLSNGKAICEFAPAPDGMALTMRLALAAQGEVENVAIEIDNPSIWVTEPVVTRSGNTLVAKSHIYTADGKPVAIPRGSIRTTVLTKTSGAEFIGCVGG